MVSRCWFFVILLTFGSFIIWIGLGYAENTNIAVPEKWVYKAMDILYDHGYLKDYPSNWVKSGNDLTRYEIAFYIKNLLNQEMKNEETGQTKMPVSIIETLQRLIAEFSKELANLGIVTTDIRKISPNLVNIQYDNDGYVDLGQISPNPLKNHNDSDSSYYYFGQYYQSFERKSFVFLPMSAVKPDDFAVLEGNINGINIVYQSTLVEGNSFLVIKGELPTADDQSVSGYYLFPIDKNRTGNGLIGGDLSNSVFTLVDEVNKIQQIDNLWRFDGSLSFAGYVKRETDFQTKMLLGSVNRRLKIGGMLIYSDEAMKTGFETKSLDGLPFGSIQTSSSGVEDLDRITTKSLESVLINFQGSKNLNPQLTVYGGLDLLYRSSENEHLFKNAWPSDAKASAGLNYQMNDYLTLLTYQSFVNSQSDSGLYSTTSIGFEYQDWVTLWLAYQLLDFDEPVISGTVLFRF